MKTQIIEKNTRVYKILEYKLGHKEIIEISRDKNGYEKYKSLNIDVEAFLKSLHNS